MLNIQSHPRSTTIIPLSSYLCRRCAKRHSTYFIFIFVHPTTDRDRNDYVVPLLKHLTNEFNIFNAVVGFKSNANRTQFLTHWPYFDKIDELQLNDNFFPDKTTNLNGKILRVGLFPGRVRLKIDENNGRLRGPDGDFTHLLTEKLNATLRVIRPIDHIDYGIPTTIHPKNGTGVLGQIIREDVDISLNARFMRLDLYQNNNIAEATDSIERDDLCLIVPRRGFHTPIDNFIHSLDVNVWLLIPFTIVVYILILRLTIKLADHFSCRPIDAIGCIFNQPMSRLPRTLPTRSIVIFWLLYCTVMSTVFSSCLTSTFTVNRPVPQIDTTWDWAASKYPVIASNDYANLIKRYVNGTESTANELFFRYLKAVEWSEYWSLIDARNTKFAYVNKRQLNSFLVNTILQDGLPLFHNMRVCPVHFHACYILPFGSPLRGRVNSIIRRLHRAGIFYYWERRSDLDNRRMSVNRVMSDSKSLKLRHIFGFYLWLGGLTIATIVFVMEITGLAMQIHRIGQRMRRKCGAYLNFVGQ